MKTEFLDEPRVYGVKGVQIKDKGRIYLEDDEQVTFVTKSGRQCDFTAKSFGFYVGPSLNGRLKVQGFKSALVTHRDHAKVFVLAVEVDKMEDFQAYIDSDPGAMVICWLDEWYPQASLPPKAQQ